MKHLYIFIVAALSLPSVRGIDFTKTNFELNIQNIEENSFNGVLDVKFSDPVRNVNEFDVNGLTVTSCAYGTDQLDVQKDCMPPKEKSEADKFKPQISDGTKYIRIGYKGIYKEGGFEKGSEWFGANFEGNNGVGVWPVPSDLESIIKMKFRIAEKATYKFIKPLKGEYTNPHDIQFILAKPKASNQKREIFGDFVKEKQASFFKLINDFSDEINKKLPNCPPEVMHFVSSSKNMQRIKAPLLIHYSTSDTYIDKLSPSRKQSVLPNIAYEIAKTCTSTFREEWLKAGIRAYISQEVCKELKNPIDQFVINQIRGRALEVDGYSKKPLSNINEKDPVFIGKSASFIGYAREFCNDDTKFSQNFKEAIKKGNLTDFAKEFGLSNIDYITQIGYPVFHVTQENNVTLVPEKFIWDGNQTSRSGNIHIVYSDGALKTITVNLNNTTTFSVEKDKFPVLNAGVMGAGYYRVNYDDKLLDKIIKELDKNQAKFTPLQRAIIVDDVFSLARSTANFKKNVPSYEKAMELADYLANENDYLPLKAAFHSFDFLDRALVGMEIRKKFIERVKIIVEELYKKFPLKIESDQVKAIQMHEIGSWACRLQVKECIKDFDKHLSSGDISSIDGIERIPVAIRDVVLCQAVRTKNENFEKLEQNLQQPESSPIMKSIIRALGCTTDKSQQEKLMEKGMKKSNLVEYIEAILDGNPDSLEVVTNFLQNNTNARSYIPEALALMAGRLNKAAIPKVQKLLEYVKDENVKDFLEQNINSTSAWIKAKEPTLKFLNGGVQNKPIAFIILLSPLLLFVNYMFP